MTTHLEDPAHWRSRAEQTRTLAKHMPDAASSRHYRQVQATCSQVEKRAPVALMLGFERKLEAILSNPVIFAHRRKYGPSLSARPTNNHPGGLFVGIQNDLGRATGRRSSSRRLGLGIRPSRWASFRAAFRARRMASDFSRALRSDGFSYALRRFISRKTPSRCIFFFRTLRA